MAHRKIAAKELSTLFSALSHPERLRIIEELRLGEQDVASLQGILEISHAKTSRQLAILRSHRLVSERQEGRHVYYRLSLPALALWIAAGLEFVEANHRSAEEIRDAVLKSQAEWLGVGAQRAVQGNSGVT